MTQVQVHATQYSAFRRNRTPLNRREAHTPVVLKDLREGAPLVCMCRQRVESDSVKHASCDERCFPLFGGLAFHFKGFLSIRLDVGLTIIARADRKAPCSFRDWPDHG